MYDGDKLCKLLKTSEAISFILPILRGVALFKTWRVSSGELKSLLMNLKDLSRLWCFSIVLFSNIS